MSGYVLSTQRMRVVKTNDRGRVIKRRTFKHGDAVTPADLEHIEGRFEALVASGALVDPDELDAAAAVVDPTRLSEGSATDNSHEDQGNDSVNYEDWDYALLKSTLEERNSERDADDQIEPVDADGEPSLKKVNIAAALRADDEAHQNEGDEDDEQ